MTDPIRTALERAARELELSAIALRQGDFETFAKRAQNEAHAARAALAKHQGEGPAVPESREPASVADHPSDEGEVSTIVDRLKELAHAVTAERWHEFSMRVPAEPLRDADLVISRSAELIQQQEAEINRLRAQQTPGEREAAAVEALQRLRQWGRLSGGGYSADVVLGVVDWIDGGMEGPLPPLPAYIKNHKKQP